MNITGLKSGDVIFISDERETAISSLSTGYGGLSYCHCGLYTGANEVVEAVPGYGVVTSSFSKYADKAVLVARSSLDEESVRSVVDQSKKFLGFKYNYLFLPNTPDRLYCSELVCEAFKTANSGKNYFTPQVLNYTEPGSFKTSDRWSNFYSEQGMSVPQGAPGSHPNSLSLDEKLPVKFFLGPFKKEE